MGSWVKQSFPPSKKIQCAHCGEHNLTLHINELWGYDSQVSRGQRLIPFVIVHFSVMSDSLRHHGLQHARLSRPSPSPRACSHSCQESVMPTNHHILYCPLLLLPSIFPSIRVFFSELSLCIRWPKYWSFSFNISPSSEYFWLISIRIEWFDFLAVQGTLKSLLHHHSSKASILQCSAFSVVQFSHPYMITGKVIALTIQTFVGKVLSLLFNMLSRFVIAFLLRSKLLLISYIQKWM